MQRTELAFQRILPTLQTPVRTRRSIGLRIWFCSKRKKTILVQKGINAHKKAGEDAVHNTFFFNSYYFFNQQNFSGGSSLVFVLILAVQWGMVAFPSCCCYRSFCPKTPFWTVYFILFFTFGQIKIDSLPYKMSQTYSLAFFLHNLLSQKSQCCLLPLIAKLFFWLFWLEKVI